MSQDELFEAVEAGDRIRVQELIATDRSHLNATTATQKTPLLAALQAKYFDLAEDLLRAGATPFIVSHSDQWAMRRIVERNSLKRDERVRLVEAAIESHVWDAPIFHAVWRRDHKLAKTILADDPSQASIRLADPAAGECFRNAAPYCGFSPLHYAVLAGDKRMVKLLLEAGAEVDAIPLGSPPDSVHTPMMWVRNGCEAIARMMVEHGADVKRTPSYMSSGSKALRTVVIENGAAGSDFFAAILLQRMDEAIRLAKGDPEVIHQRLTGAYADTPLHMAVQRDSHPLIEILLDHGMDVDTPTAGGYTALTMAPEFYSSLDTIRLLVDRGADVRVGDDAPLHGAIWQHAYRHWDYESVIRYLVRKGAAPRGLQHCAIAGNMNAAKLLIELGADVNSTRDDGWPSLETGHTALDYCTGVAGDQQHEKMARFLRSQGGLPAAELA